MFGDDRQRSERDGIRVKTLDIQVYWTRIGLQTMVANDRRGSGAAGHFRGNFGGNFRCSIGVTPGGSAFDAKNQRQNAMQTHPIRILGFLIRFRNLHYRINYRQRDTLRRD
jgi:hypothetical protein